MAVALVHSHPPAGQMHWAWGGKGGVGQCIHRGRVPVQRRTRASSRLGI